MKSFRIAPFAPLSFLVAIALGAPLSAQEAALGGCAVAQCFAEAAAFAPLAVVAAPVEPAGMPELAVRVEARGLQFDLHGEGKFLGAVIVALRPDLWHSFVGLPPLLGDHAVLGTGCALGTLSLRAPMDRLPPGVRLYAQGVIVSAGGIRSTPVVAFGLSTGAAPGK